LGGVVLGDCLGTLRDGMLGKFSREEESDRGLDLSGSDGVSLLVAGELSSLKSDSFEDIVDERVHDAHGLVGDSSVGVDLLEDLVDEGGIGLVVLLLSLLLGSSLGLLGDLLGLGGSSGLLGGRLGGAFGGFLSSFSGGFLGCHGSKIRDWVFWVLEVKSF